jgi:hypothetical protein
MNQTLNPIAELKFPDSGIIVEPIAKEYAKKDVQSFFCPDPKCKDPKRRMFIKKSSLGNIFFSHYGKFSHDIYPETLLHKLAIKWFENKSDFEIPEVKVGSTLIEQQTLSLDPQKTVLEYKGIDTVQPDIYVETTNGFKLAIEIAVTHKVDDDKEKKLSDTNTPTLEIDLERFYLENQERCRVDKGFIEQHLDQLLTDLSLMKWIVPPKAERCEDELQVQEELDNTGGIIVPPKAKRFEDELLEKDESENTWGIIAAIVAFLLVVVGVFYKRGDLDSFFRKKVTAKSQLKKKKFQ